MADMQVIVRGLAEMAGGTCIMVATILVPVAEPGRTIMYRDQDAEASF